MSNVWYERKSLHTFYEEYSYKGFVLVNELYEDDDVQKNNWMWGKVDGNDIVDAVLLDGLSSSSYAPFKEVIENFHKKVDSLLT